MLNSPLKDALLKYNEENRARFHTPSHKGHANALSLTDDVLSLDVTELPDTGSLFDGTGPLAEAEKLAARFFNTAGTFFQPEAVRCACRQCCKWWQSPAVRYLQGG